MQHPVHIFNCAIFELSSDNKTLTCRKCIATVDLMRTALEFTDISFDSSTVCKKIPLVRMISTLGLYYMMIYLIYLNQR